MIRDAPRSSTLAIGFVVVAVAVAFADSSIVVLALPELYAKFHTTIEGVSWVVTAYNAAVAVVGLALVLFVHRLRAVTVLATGLAVFMAASITCSVANSCWRARFRSSRRSRGRRSAARRSGRWPGPSAPRSVPRWAVC